MPKYHYLHREADLVQDHWRSMDSALVASMEQPEGDQIARLHISKAQQNLVDEAGKPWEVGQAEVTCR